MDKRIVNIFKDGNIVIPVYLLKIYKDLNIKLEDFIFLMYLYNKGNNTIFDPKTISEELNISMENVLNEISILSDKHLIELEIIKEKNISNEVISLNNFYDKLSLLLIDNKSIEEDNNGIFDFIEKEFARTLSSMEYEIIKAWIESGNSEELIKEAVKEAVFNGVNNLRYIDKILYEWNKKGIKNKDDVEKNRKQFRKKDEEKEELFDYNWFEDDEDE